MDEIDEMLIEVRAGTQGFAADLAQMRGALDTTLVSGFRDAGSVLERGLLSAIRRGSLGFDDLRRVAFQAIDQIASQALRLGLDGLLGANGGSRAGGGLAGLLGGLAGAVFGLPGRATGGPVSPGRGYLVGERGPELFVPTASGRIEAAGGGVRNIAITVNVRGEAGSEPQRLAQTGRQLARAVRRAVAQGED